MKVIAMYLPQFHRVKENDEWWGEGFTEWTTVKYADKLFPEHEQPRIPMDNNYYNLLDSEVVRYQARLMHQYKIDGMCFYHYYFKNGRKILEKPAENLLKWKDIDMPFCFSWANESWVRSWSKLSEVEGNPWSAKFDIQNKSDFTDNGILLEQDYGREKEWEKHYRYLSPFFHDDRYIKYDGMPVFMIYKPANISCLKEMLVYWDVLAKKDGFPAIYTIGTNINDKEKYGIKGINIQEPQDTMAKFYSGKYDNDKGVMRFLDYQDVWQHLVEKVIPDGLSLGGFVGYDDTPRRGHGGSVIHFNNPYTFFEGMKLLLQKAEKKKSPFVFINAWNEWGEGMYLEPDEKFGYRFLEAFCQARDDVSRMQTSKIISDGDSKQSIIDEENLSLRHSLDRYRGYWRVLDLWVGMLEQGKTPLSYLEKAGYKSVAVYGYGMLGKHLVYQLKQEGFNVKYVIDRQVEKKADGIPLYPLQDGLPEVDAVIVTVLYDYDSIANKIKKIFDVDILPIDSLFIL